MDEDSYAVDEPRISDDDLKALFHNLWGAAKESPEYDRKKWIEFHVELQRRKIRV